MELLPPISLKQHPQIGNAGTCFSGHQRICLRHGEDSGKNEEAAGHFDPRTTPFNALVILAGGRSFHPVHPEGRLAYSDVELLAPDDNTIVIVQHCVFRDGESDVPCKLLELPQSDPLLTIAYLAASPLAPAGIPLALGRRESFPST